MQKTLQSIGFLLGIVGAAGLVHHFVHGFKLFAFVSRIPLLSRYELYASAALVVLGLALLIAGDRLQPPHDHTTSSNRSSPNSASPPAPPPATRSPTHPENEA
jgi:zinc transporter ZupT